MSILDIRVYGDAVLRHETAPIEAVDDELLALIDDMIDTMYAADGVGLAANQVGISRRLAIFDLGFIKGSDAEDVLVFLNPEIVSTRGSQLGDEGCLSLPGISAELERPNFVTVRATGLDGKVFEIEGEGLLARAFCHELEHLDGKLFIDNLSPAQRKLLESQLRKISRVA